MVIVEMANNDLMPEKWGNPKGNSTVVVSVYFGIALGVHSEPERELKVRPQEALVVESAGSRCWEEAARETLSPCNAYIMSRSVR